MSSRRRGFRLIASGLAAAMAIAGCTSSHVSQPALPIVHEYRRPAPVGHVHDAQVVRASWYGRGFAGKRTSSGERYDPNQMTAASKTLPLGSVVSVTNPRNGRSVRVRINDCGPFVGGRSLDLSHRAAERLGITHTGVARVKVTRVSTPPGAEGCHG
jgi:rare lipoprotein A (peptidoglycan hydrolase)